MRVTQPRPASPPTVAWWRDRRRRDRFTVYGFAVLGIGGILLGGAFVYARGDQREIVVTMVRDPSRSVDRLARDRQELKDDCGALAGVSVVGDEGDPRVQGRFPVRFGVRGASNPERAALDACLARHQDVVRGIRVEGE